MPYWFDFTFFDDMLRGLGWLRRGVKGHAQANSRRTGSDRCRFIGVGPAPGNDGVDRFERLGLRRIRQSLSLHE